MRGFDWLMLRAGLLSLAAALLFAAPASATLVYERLRRQSDTVVIAARNDGTDPRVVAHGSAPRISPHGHRIAYYVANRSGDRLYVVGNRGRHRRLLAQTAWDEAPLGPLAWSPDERYVATGDLYGGGAWLIDVPHAKAVHLGFGADDFGSATFSPDGETVAICHGLDRDEGELTAIDVESHARRSLGPGCQGVWGERGLAFWHGDSLWLRARVGVKAHRLWRPPQYFYPVDWSEEGNRLLVFSGAGGTPVRAVAIDLTPKRVTHSAAAYSQVVALSRDGREVLGESGGNVVAAPFSGTPKVLAYNALAPDWTK